MFGEWYLPPGKCQAISTITEGIISISHPAPLSSQTRIPQTSSPLVDKSQATQAALLQIRRSEAEHCGKLAKNRRNSFNLNKFRTMSRDFSDSLLEARQEPGPSGRTC